MQISDGQIVSIHFTLRSADGKVLETTEGAEPMSFQFGARKILPGLAQAMQGMEVGGSREGVIPAGRLVPADQCPRRRIPASELPDGARPPVGHRFQARDAAGGKAVHLEVVAVDATGLDVAVLHPLHETEVHYEVRVVSARRANLPPPPPVEVDEDLTDALTEE
jgi:FKBP-type peptidyl-prolyl cis-trans isomerase 2